MKFSFLVFGFGRIDMTDILRSKSYAKSRNRISRSDTARQRVWEREKMSQSQAMFLCVCFMYSSKGHATWLWLVVFDPYFFVAEKPLPMTRACTVVNFRNLHGQFGSFRSLNCSIVPVFRSILPKYLTFFKPNKTEIIRDAFGCYRKQSPKE